MKKIKASFVIPEGPKARANKTGINFMIFILSFVENCLLNIIFQTGLDPVLIQRIAIGFEVILEKLFVAQQMNSLDIIKKVGSQCNINITLAGSLNQEAATFKDPCFNGCTGSGSGSTH